jgi:transporter family-2 protein
MNKSFFLLPIFAGIAIAIQAVINGQLRVSLSNPYYTAFISFITGTFICAVIVLLNKQPVPPLQIFTTIPWYKLTGGLLGAIVVTSVIIAVPKMSTSALFALLVAGQLLTGFMFDTTGMLGVKTSPITLYKISGALMLIAGAYLINKK